jgi:hypothetical protein
MAKDINDEMKQAGDYAIKLAKGRFGVDLDYSDNSLYGLEKLIEDASQQHTMDLSDEKSLNNSIMRTAGIWGSFLGEVMQRKWGGEWKIDENSDRTCLIHGVKVNPIFYIQQRCTGQNTTKVNQYLSEVAVSLFS